MEKHATDRLNDAAPLLRDATKALLRELPLVIVRGYATRETLEAFKQAEAAIAAAEVGEIGMATAV